MDCNCCELLANMVEKYKQQYEINVEKANLTKEDSIDLSAADDKSDSE